MDKEQRIADLEKEVAQLEDRFRSFIDSSGQAVFCYELDESISNDLTPEQTARAFLDAKLVICNNTYAQARGARSPAELYGQTVVQLARAPLERVLHLIEVLVRHGNHQDGMEVEQRRPDGTMGYAMTKAQLVERDGRIIRMWGILRDTTDQKRADREREALERQLRQAQKMESLGLLAGGIAHDFNNLLLVISGYVEMAQEHVTSHPGMAAESLAHVLEATGRATELTRGLLAFARDHVPNPAVVPVCDVLRELTTLLRRMLPERVALQLVEGHRAEGKPLRVRAERANLEQALINLCINAVDAIEGTGTITIETDAVELSESEVEGYPWLRAGAFARIRVTDTGSGVPDDLRDRIFEPFFTTKHSRGTGLGLAIVYGVAKNHGGLARVRNTEAGGARFEMLFPLVEGDRQRPQKTPAGIAVGGSETILVAEDHELVREMLATTLSRAGYRVLVACDGVEAKQRFDEHAEEIDLVLLDAVMPRANGDEVFRHVVARRPHLPIIVASGHTRGTFGGNFFEEQGVKLLTKPFDNQELLRRIRQALDKRH